MPNHYLPPGRPILTASVIQEVHESISGLRRLQLLCLLLRQLLELLGCQGVRRQFRVLDMCD